LNDKIAISKGTNKKSMNPITEPAPWILEAGVTTSFDSLTLKKQVNMHEPTAKATMKMIIVIVIPPDIS
jgi:hypothetical protein